MNDQLDLNLLPLYRIAGFDENTFPGLYLALPPRKATRSRAEDRLILYLHLIGNAPLSEMQQEQMLVRLAQSFYKTPGSVTLALRKIAEQLNQSLLDRNLHNLSGSQQGIGVMAMVVLRSNRVILGQTGPGHAFRVTKDEVEYYYDPQGAGRELGLARSLSIRFYQAELQPGEVLVLTPKLPSTWNTNSLKGLSNQALDTLRRRLLSQSGPDLNALVIQAQAGTGKLRLLRTKPIAPMAQPASGEPDISIEQAAPEAGADGLEQAAETPVSESFPEMLPSGVGESPQIDATAEPVQPAGGTAAVFTPVQSAPILRPKPTISQPSIEAKPSGETASTKTGSQRTDRNKKPSIPRPALHMHRPKISLTPLVRIGSVVGGAFRSVFQTLARLLLFVLKSLLPDESLFHIPASTMAFLAVAVAVVVATMGGAVYVQRGRSAQFDVYFTQAFQAAEVARLQTDPLELRTDWETAIDFLDKAEAYQKNRPESLALRSEGQAVLDRLDGIQRLDFQPAITGGLSGSVHITRLVASESDLYLLNSNGGNVLRAVLTGGGYEIDPNFVCSPGPSVGPLVDIVSLPKGNNLKATVLGMDTYGNLLYCIPEESPAVYAPAAPHTNWGTPNGFTLDSGDLYMLDPATNAVWVYQGMDFSLAPHLFFGSQVPYMQDVVDLAVNNDDLYLLHSDGRLTTCVYSALQESPTRCEDPASYSDTRPGRESGPLILDAPFSQVTYTQPPDPSIYMLDPVHNAIYHFSLRLTFQRQFRALNPLAGDSATAFAISPNRYAFIALGNQVYYASLP